MTKQYTDIETIYMAAIMRRLANEREDDGGQHARMVRWARKRWGENRARMLYIAAWCRVKGVR